jgi:hypothetical protein
MAVPCCWNKAAAEATASEEESRCLRFDGVRNAPRHMVLLSYSSPLEMSVTSVTFLSPSVT